MTKPLVSVIVVARDEEQNLARCLAAVRDQAVDFPIELIVVDSGSRDRTAEVARSFGARVIAIPRESFQHGRTRQMASEQASGEFLVYLVADAAPADRQWLAALVAAVAADEKVAGAYSRQVPREGAGPLEAHRLRHRASSGLAREVREITPGLDFFALSAEERFRFCEFDDVSCCRRKSLLERFPIPAVDWAEDLLWARQVLLARYRIVYEPASVVRHSHADTGSHAFRRGWLDQSVVRKWFGVVYFRDGAALLRGYPRLFREQARALKEHTGGGLNGLRLLGWNVVRLAAEMKGNYLAGGSPRSERVEKDMIRAALGSGPLRRKFRGQVLATSFTLDADTRRTLFMNPNAAAGIELTVPPGARLKFSAAINPAARPHRKETVRFIVAINEAPVWQKEIGPGQPGEPPRWTEGEVELSPWAGQKVHVLLITRAGNTDYAWAGWGEPRIVTDRLSLMDRAWNYLLGAVEKKVGGEPLRHP